MSTSQTGTPKIRRLSDLRSRFEAEDSREKLALLNSIRDIAIRNSRELKLLHGTLCFIRAFPDTTAHHHAAHSLLGDFERRVCNLPAKERSKLWDSGIAGTPVHYSFSHEVASWLSRNAPRSVTIDWDEIADTSRLDELLERLLLPSEADYFDSGLVSSKEWVDLAAGNNGATSFDWLLAQLQQTPFMPVWVQLYNAAELPLTWTLGGTEHSKSRNILAGRKVVTRQSGMRRHFPAAKKVILRPLETLQQVSPRAGVSLINVAMASLAVRHRETLHFNYANPREVYVADVGHGISVAIFGLQPKHRYPLECTMGYLILSNGVPIGYGGGSAVFRQVNIGINIFDEYRGSEAAFLWVQVMRVYHHLFGCTRFIANPYQFGSDNTEALQSGAFWFYYRLGYRPVLPAIRKLAQREMQRIRRDKSYRCKLPILQRLASCDMHLRLPGSLASDLFEERWIETSSMLASKALAAVDDETRAESAARVGRQVARDLGLRSIQRWSREEQLAYYRLAPIVAAAIPATWPADARKSMRKLLRSKGGSRETRFARLLCEHEHFLSALRSCCRAAEKG